MPRRLQACARRWGLEDVRALDGGRDADVFAARRAGGDEIVSKLARALEQAQTEAAALAAWVDMRAAVRLIDVDIASGALLLERILPGTPLGAGDDERAIETAADLLASLHQATPGPFPFARLVEYAAGPDSSGLLPPEPPRWHYA